MILSRFLILLLFPLTMVLAFQNCSDSSFEQPEEVLSQGNDLDTDENGGEDGSTVLNGLDGLVSLNLNNGDSVTFLKGAGNAFPPSQQQVVLAKNLGRIFLTTETQTQSADPKTATDLPQFYCDNSVLPHCRHLTKVECKSTHCDNSGIPVICSEQVRINGGDLQNLFNQLSGIKTTEKRDLPNLPSIADCDSPNVFFSKTGDAPVIVSLAKKECVTEGRLFAFEGHEALENTMNSYIEDLSAKATSCNLFHQYRWKNSKFEYSANSGFTTPENAFFHSMTYKGNQRADLRYKLAGASLIRCAEDILLTEAEIRSFFPEDGLRYDILKTDTALADAPTASVTFKDESYGAGGEAKFYLDEASAFSFNGGAILAPVHEGQIRDSVNRMIQRAEGRNLSKNCP